MEDLELAFLLESLKCDSNMFSDKQQCVCARNIPLFILLDFKSAIKLTKNIYILPHDSSLLKCQTGCKNVLSVISGISVCKAVTLKECNTTHTLS